LKQLARISLATLILTVLIAGPAVAQIPDYVPDKIDATADKQAPGWHPMLKASGTGAFSHASNVVGTDDGSTWNLGLVINGGLDYRSPTGHIWENVLKYQLTYSKTPLFEEFYKSLDNFDFSSTYLYELPAAPWLGPFASFRALTSLFPGYVIRPVNTDLKLLNKEGTLIDDTEILLANEKLDLTDSFSPTTLRESVGMFARPVQKRIIEFQARLGAGAWEVFVRDGLTIDTEEDGVLTVREMQDSIQLGGELELTAKGVITDGVNYGAKAGFMMPFYHNATTDLEGADLLNMEFEATLGVKLTTWASLDYALKAYKYPLIVNDWQMSSSLLLTATASIL
jgi:hypothetical protein